MNGWMSSVVILEVMFGPNGAACVAGAAFEGLPRPAAVFVPVLGLRVVPKPPRKERSREAKSVSGDKRAFGMERLDLLIYQLRSRATCTVLHTRSHSM